MKLRGEIIQLNTLEEKLKKQLQKLDDPKAESSEAQEILKQLKNLQDELTSKEEQIQNLYKWEIQGPVIHSLILASQTLFAGGKNHVMAFDTETGKQVWQAQVNGNAHGLAVVNGRLFVSTDQGDIACFETPEKTE